MRFQHPGHTRVWIAAAALLASTAAADPPAPGADLLRRGQYERAAAQLVRARAPERLEHADVR